MSAHPPPSEASDSSFWASVYTQEPPNVLCGVLTDLNLHRFTLHQHLSTHRALTETPLLHTPFQQALPEALSPHLQLYTNSIHQIEVHVRRALTALDALGRHPPRVYIQELDTTLDDDSASEILFPTADELVPGRPIRTPPITRHHLSGTSTAACTLQHASAQTTPTTSHTQSTQTDFITHSFTKSNRPLRTRTLSQPLPKPTTPCHTPQPRQIFILWSLRRLSLLPTSATHPLPPPRLPILLPHKLQHHHPPMPPPSLTNNPTLTQHTGNTPTSYPPHQLIRSLLQQDQPTSCHPLGVHPGAHAPKHLHAQPHHTVHASVRAALLHRPTSAAAPLHHNHEPLPPFHFYHNHPNRHLPSHQRTTHRR